MNYKHIFHAGSFSDVFKHLVLIELLKKMLEKDTPFCVIDTHAGSGIYNLAGKDAKRTLEYQTGIEKLYGSKEQNPLLASFLDIVRHLNIQKNAKSLEWYPGSPYILSKLCRTTDRMQLCELHPDEYELLKDRLVYKKNVNLFLANGYTQLNALVPPQEKRGLVLIDPPYEEPDEFEHIEECLAKVYRKFPTGVYAIWYPIKARYPVKAFYDSIAMGPYKKALAAEFLIYPCNEPNRLNGCGMLIINPPWKIDLNIKELLPVLLKKLNCQKTGSTSVEWLKDES